MHTFKVLYEAIHVHVHVSTYRVEFCTTRRKRKKKQISTLFFALFVVRGSGSGSSSSTLPPAPLRDRAFLIGLREGLCQIIRVQDTGDSVAQWPRFLEI